MTLHNVKNYQF